MLPQDLRQNMVSTSSPHNVQHPQQNFVLPKSPKRKLHATFAPLPSKLQTTNLDTTPTSSRKLSADANTNIVDETLSPRAAVSVRMQGLRLRGSSSSPTVRGPPVPVRRESWSREQGWDMKGLPSVQRPEPEHGVSGGPSAAQAGSNETGKHSASSVEIAESSQGDENGSFRRDVERGMFEFKAGGRMDLVESPRAPKATPATKRTAFAIEEDNHNDEEMQNAQTPSKRRRQKSPSRSPSPPLMQAIPRSQSPSARKLSHRSPPPSEMSSSPGDAESSQYWWQPSEIVGHDPNDPEEDHRGINGIGYQKTKAEQWKISEKKKRQIAEWRSREAKEARSIRAGGRRVIMGRVSKPGSRAGSPSDSTARGRSSPRPRSVSDEKKMEEVVRRAVRFDLG